ncbi:MAG: IPT/TIG domain-containing protein [Hyphomicrobium sp.]
MPIPMWRHPRCSASTPTTVQPTEGLRSRSPAPFHRRHSVTFNGSAATAITVVNATTIPPPRPAHAAGVVNVAVTTPAGTGTGTNAFTYMPPPTFTSVSPNSGTTLGGTAVTITGTGFFASHTGVTFGGAAATSIVVVNAPRSPPPRRRTSPGS